MSNQKSTSRSKTPPIYGTFSVFERKRDDKKLGNFFKLSVFQVTKVEPKLFLK